MNVGENYDTVDLDMEVENHPEPPLAERISKYNLDCKTKTPHSDWQMLVQPSTVSSSANRALDELPNNPKSVAPSNAVSQAASKPGANFQQSYEVNGEKMVPLHVKGNNSAPVVLISEEELATLKQKQKEGEACTLSCVSQSLSTHSLVNSESNRVPLNSQTLESPSYNLKMCSTYEQMLPKTSLPKSPKTNNSPQPLEHFTTTPQIRTVRPSAINILQNTSKSSLPVLSGTRILPGPQNSAVTSQTSTITTLKNVVNCNPGIPRGSGNSTVTTLNSGKTNEAVTSSIPTNIPLLVGMSVNKHKTVAYVIPSSQLLNTPVTLAPPLNPSVTVLPRTIANISTPNASVAATSSTVNGTSPRISVANQPRYLFAKIRSSPPPSGGNVATSQIRNHAKYIIDPGTCRKLTRVFQKFPQTAPKQSFPIQTRDVIMPSVQPDGSVRLERKTVAWPGEARRGNRDQFAINEVSNNPLESGVAKKYVVSPISSAAVFSASSTQKTDSKTQNTTPRTSFGRMKPYLALRREQSNSSKLPSTSSPSIAQPEGLDPQCPVESVSSSDKSAFQWHHPCSDEPPSAMDIPEVVEGSGAENDSVIISDDDSQPLLKASVPPPLEKTTDNNSNASRLQSKSSDGKELSVRNDLAVPVADPVIISDEDSQPALKTSPPVVEKPEINSNNSRHHSNSSDPEERSVNNYLVPKIDLYSIQSTVNAEDSKVNNPNVDKSPHVWHQPCTGSEMLSAGNKSRLIEDSGSKTQNQPAPVKFKVIQGVWTKSGVTKKSGITKSWPREQIRSKKENKKKSKMEISKVVKKKKNESKMEISKVMQKKKKKKKKKKSDETSPAIVQSSPQSKVPCSISGPPVMISISDSLQVPIKPGVEDSKTVVRNRVSSSPVPTSQSGDVDPLIAISGPSLGQTSFKWHHPCSDTKPEKIADPARDSRFKTEQISLSDSDVDQAQVSPSPSFEPNPENTADIPEHKYSPRCDPDDPSNENEVDIPRIEPYSIHSVTVSKIETTTSPLSIKSMKRSSCETKDEFLSSPAEDSNEKEGFTVGALPARAASPGLKFHYTERKDRVFHKLRERLKKRMRAKAEGVNTDIASLPLKRVLVGAQGASGYPNEIRKRIPQSYQHKGISKGSESSSGRINQTVSFDDKTVTPNVLRDCIVRKAIQDCYSEGVVPTIDKIYHACYDSGLYFTKTSVNPHLISIGYGWVKCDSGRLLVEDHQVTAKRIKYLDKLKKFRGKNLVYILVSDYVKQNENVWQVSQCDVSRPFLDSARVVLHAMDSHGLVKGGFEVLKLGLFGLRRNDIISWLKCKVFPNIPKGSVVILGRHSVFDLNQETEERPHIGYSKERIVSWLTSHKVPSVNVNLPKAVLLRKVDYVILPKTSVFDRLIRQNGFVPLHLPEHHIDLNPLEFLWRDVLDKLFKTPEVKSVDDFQDFVSQEFSSCSETTSSVARNLVRKFESTYREFDLRFDELFDDMLSVAGPVSGGVQGTAAPTGTTRRPKKRTCPVCAKYSINADSFRCSACKSFWQRLNMDFKHKRLMPVCNEKSHVDVRPYTCKGCRRHQYELALVARTKRPLPIPPVTEAGKQHRPTLFPRRRGKNHTHENTSKSSSRSSDFTSGNRREDEEEHVN